MINIAVFVSGGGSNLQAVMDGISSGLIQNAKIVLVLSSRADAYALDRASGAGIPTAVISPEEYPDVQVRTSTILAHLKEADTSLIVLAGYMSILPKELVGAYAGRIINIHPSLIPKHCGKGYYGLRVHEAVLKSGDRESGATVHYVDEGVDTGRIILQRKVPVLPGDTPETLAARVLETEHEIIVEAVNICLKSQEFCAMVYT
ncbi:MAG: phosphoribosylglycinamide formyltransferase [Clostridiales Family XIII bacterium]|jgi:phosphoribosylglycinamide formyltransferase-1|nr:phosphoribosylglycinamide formyltransferase [Clostridiales Family XIII bacterium]